MNIKVRLTIMNFLEFAVWGAYLTSMGNYLANAGFGSIIGWFYSIQGVVSMFMPGIMGVVADRWIQAQRLLSLCHLVAGTFMAVAGFYGMSDGCDISLLFTLYAISVAFYMPTLALSNSVAFNSLTKAGLDTVKDFPPIRIFGTIGFICTMWLVDICGYQSTSQQFIVSGALSLILAVYALTLPASPVKAACTTSDNSETIVQKLGLDAIQLFKKKEMAIFFIFSMFLGVSLQITNGYGNTYISAFKEIAEFADTFGAQHANILISISQISETCCILLIPFFLKRFGIKSVMMIAMGAWVLRFGLFGTGNPGDGVWMFILSCIVYGVAFDFFNISGALFVDKSTDSDIRSSAQGLFMIMTNGLGATVGTLSAQAVVNNYVFYQPESLQIEGWRTCWFIFAGYALVVLVMFAIIFQPKKTTK
ncbi:MFS transporter [Prevotella sp. PINT]|jgi:Nucleoside H+ symporter.|uniref:MFS transporter n=1 Tax=Palleniella intestinalis TaxID=2736291 RepID=UPI001557E91A|nr:MFS transporter [Palleniella intestinalis]NPD80424.1 MFS transporter [Palleniella intestinalis]